MDANSEDRQQRSDTSFREGVEILLPDGRPLGVIDRVVVEPRAKRVTHVVVRKGVVFSTDRVVPVDWITVNADGLQVEVVESPDEFPRFEENRYFQVEAPGEGSAVLYQYPSMLWRTDKSVTPRTRGVVKRAQRNVPEDTVPVRVNSAVVSSDGHKLGRLSEVSIHGDDGQLDHIVVTSGLRSLRRAVPLGWVTVVDENRVHLAIDSESFDRIPVEGEDDEGASAGEGSFQS